MLSNLLAKIKTSFAVRKNKREVSKLEKELEKLKNKDYLPIHTLDVEDEYSELKHPLMKVSSHSEEYEFDDMYSDPVRAVKILRRIIELKYNCPISPITPKQKRIMAKRSEYRKFD